MKIETQISCTAIRKTLPDKISGIYSPIATLDTHKRGRLHARHQCLVAENHKRLGPKIHYS